MTASGVYQLIFTHAMYDVPILQKIGKSFRLNVAIRRAMLSEEGGWAEVKLTGDDEEIGRAIAELQTTGVSVTGPLEAAIEPDPEFVLAAKSRGT
ncbi:MAG: NIL domain-containing protein [Armatimonas sp.]